MGSGTLEWVVKCAMSILENIVEGGKVKHDGVMAILSICICDFIYVWRKVMGW